MPKGVRFFPLCPGFGMVCFEQELRGVADPFVGKGGFLETVIESSLKGEIV